MKERRDKQTNQTQNTVTVREGGGCIKGGLSKEQAGAAAQLAEGLCGIHKALGSKTRTAEQEYICDVVLVTLNQ